MIRRYLEWDRRSLQARFYVDPATGLPHKHNHQVIEDEVIKVLDKPSEDRPGRERRLLSNRETSRRIFVGAEALRSLLPQRDHRIDARGAGCRNIAGHQRDHGQQQRYSDVDCRIGRLDAHQ